MPIRKLQRQYTWKKQQVDARDYKFERFKSLKPTVTSLPDHVNNRPWCSQVFDQGELGSCTANAWAGLLQFNEIKNGRGGKLYKDLSRLFIYYNERVIENTINEDSGAQLRDGAKAIATYGVCPETEWVYNINKFTLKPSPQCYTDALPNVIHSYYALNTLTDMQTCLASGQCFVFGISVYDSFESQQVASTGVVPMPNLQTEQLLGGHAVMAIGYNNAQKRLLVRNSWGLDWGLSGNLKGYFTLPYDYVTNPNLASDFWTVVKDV